MADQTQSPQDDGREEIELELDDETLEYLQKCAAERNCSIDEVIESILVEEIARMEKAHSGEEKDTP